MPGVKAILTADDLPGAADGRDAWRRRPGDRAGERGLTNEPLYEGEPILAVAAVDELTAAEAIEKIQIEFEPLPFVVDPIESLRPERAERADAGQRLGASAAHASAACRPAAPGAPAAAPAPPRGSEDRRLEMDRRGLRRGAPDGQLPIGKHTDEWVVGDVEAGFKKADLVLDETFVTPITEPPAARDAHGDGVLAERQAVPARLDAEHRADDRVGRALGRHPSRPDVVLISEYTGGGFGSKIPGSIFMAIPALLSKKANAPVMMRITREDEHYIGRARPAMLARVKVGFRKDGRITALDMFAVMRQRSVRRAGRRRSAGGHRLARLSAGGDALARPDGAHQHAAATSRSARRAGCRATRIMEPILAKAARKLGIDQVDDPQDQRARGQGAVRRAARERPAELRDERVRQGGARQGRRALQVGREEGATAASATARRCAASASR